jgi:hypothetical protein
MVTNHKLSILDASRRKTKAKDRGASLKISYYKAKYPLIDTTDKHHLLHDLADMNPLIKIRF